MEKNSFETWFDTQLGKGLVDIKFAVTPGKGVTRDAIKNELLVSEAMIAAGYCKKSAPQSSSFIPNEVMEVIRASRI